MTSSTPTCRPFVPALLLGLLATALSLMVLGFQPLREPLYWWHISVGEAIAGWQRIPQRQLFLFTVEAQTPWIYTSWLGSVILSEMHALGGAGLNLLIRNVMAAFTAGFLVYFAARRTHALWPITSVGLAAMGGLYIAAPVGPSSLVLPLVAVTLAAGFLLFEYPAKIWPALFFPATLFAVINIDFATALACMAVAVIIGADLLRRALTSEVEKSVVAGAAIVGSSLFGLLGFAYGPASLPEALAMLIQTSPPLVSPAAICIVIGTAAVVVAVITTESAELSAPRPTLVLLVCSTALIAIGAHSAIAVWLITLILAALGPLRAHLQRRGPRVPTSRTLALVLIVAIPLSVLVQPGVPTRVPVVTQVHDDLRERPPEAGVLPAHLPLRCAEELRRTGRTLQLFHPPEYAGFLLHHLLRIDRPYPLLFDDHRKLTDQATRQFVDDARTSRATRGYLQQYGVNAVVIDRLDYPIMVEELSADPIWRELLPGHSDTTICFYRIDDASDSD